MSNKDRVSKLHSRPKKLPDEHLAVHLRAPLQPLKVPLLVARVLVNDEHVGSVGCHDESLVELADDLELPERLLVQLTPQLVLGSFVLPRLDPRVELVPRQQK